MFGCRAGRRRGRRCLCHRAVRSHGKLAGYRWGIERKAELLKREREALTARR
ncbi:MGMT family protein [Methylomonas sp. HW2-6]|uniref:MGMT family protein n=1 Tax=Methylomonas sp. HW2-6 TaxID=3376687 RepID=UPI0040434B36